MSSSSQQTTPLTDLQLSRLHSFESGPTITIPFPTAHSAFEHHAALDPSAPALRQLSQSLSYGETNNAANLLATRLRRDFNVRPGSRVTLVLRRSVQMVVAILAVLKAGGQYVPLDGNVVTEGTLEHVIGDTESAVVLAMTQHVEKAEKCAKGRPVLDLEKAMSEDEGMVGVKPEELATGEDGVYCVYTSGKLSIFLLVKFGLDWMGSVVQLGPPCVQ